MVMGFDTGDVGEIGLPFRAVIFRTPGKYKLRLFVEDHVAGTLDHDAGDQPVECLCVPSPPHHPQSSEPDSVHGDGLALVGQLHNIHAGGVRQAWPNGNRIRIRLRWILCFGYQRNRV